MDYPLGAFFALLTVGMALAFVYLVSEDCIF